MSVCDRCGATFACGMTDVGADQPCWCTQLPSLPASAYVRIEGETSDEAVTGHCFCPGCLRTLISNQDAAQA